MSHLHLDDDVGRGSVGDPGVVDLRHPVTLMHVTEGMQPQRPVTVEPLVQVLPHRVAPKVLSVVEI